MEKRNEQYELYTYIYSENMSIVLKQTQRMQRSLNSYLNGMLTNEEVIKEMLKLAKQIAAA